MNGEGRVVYMKQPNERGGQSGVVKQPNEWGRQSCVCEAAK